MTVYTILYAIVKKEWLNPCAGPEEFWLWQFTPVPILGVCMLQIGYILNRVRKLMKYFPLSILFFFGKLLKSAHRYIDILFSSHIDA
jgi:hypothetical protein